ncbi:glycosyl hydrolase 115 family protein [Novosphingobium profundi]|uniref:glycosyl hydrolase 115 family protein n=1 Tax=Novosphingobium profundi TaxID=1774954 RepID=UPI001BDB4837|nr:glycosyl hydrolase 115 family protein [Novosphingobium profundi]MBT0670700.1 glycosyl hydrolase 115 family protein [Novosphingobium profundi]
MRVFKRLKPSSLLVASGLLAGLPTASPAAPPAPAPATGPWLIAQGTRPAAIIHEDSHPLTLAADMLARDLAALSGGQPVVSARLEECGQVCIVLAGPGSDLLAAVARDTGFAAGELDGQWECYVRQGLASRSVAGRRYLVIAGSDVRGTIWGAVDLTRELGVSAWEWWADVTPRQVARIGVDPARKVSASPSVRYRGIFLNDEDWGLQPWAAHTFEPEVGDIGPRTYARIFELMWRLKANLIWPAMHDSTAAFYSVPGNAEAARDHAIVVGTSHAEPMMRNNVREWHEASDGPFNFFVNRPKMERYWQQRIEDVAGFENVYTVGLRGVHDSAMEGASSPEAARDALQEAITLQRGLLEGALHRPADQVPQALTLYKEVLETYRMGLRVPDDVTLVWPEDNYGYINQLPDAREQARAGGSGVYYHVSYWGRPHDYLWLATTHPALVREQMERAAHVGADRIWVLNVGDIKPAEYLMDYFLDMAFDHAAIARSPHMALTRWAARQFGPGAADEVAGIMTEYYDLAFERRPEFMGFSQVEPITPVRIGDYVRSGGGEAWRRIDRYAALVRRAEALAERMPADRRDAFLELVLYPLRGAASLNARNLKLDLAALYARQGRPVANLLADQARAAHARIVADTATYNALAGGKWRGIMDMAPRRLPVFAEPVYPHAEYPAREGCTADTGELTFVAGRAASHVLTVESRGKAADWQLSGLKGLTAARLQGHLDAANGYMQRIAITYDGQDRAPALGPLVCGAAPIAASARVVASTRADQAVEIDHIVSMPAAIAALEGRDWERVPELGSSGLVLRSRLDLPSRAEGRGNGLARFEFDTSDKGDAALQIVALPVHPLTLQNHVRIAVRIDEGEPRILDFETHGRSDEWKANVLSNTARREIRLPQLEGGHHTVRVEALDPGFLLDRLELHRDGAPAYYGVAPTR